MVSSRCNRCRRRSEGLGGLGVGRGLGQAGRRGPRDRARRPGEDYVCSGRGSNPPRFDGHAGTVRPLSIDTVWADLSVTQVGWSARERAAQSSLKRAAVQPKVDLHREPGVLDRVVQIASTRELDVAADRAQTSAAAEVERAVCFHGAVDRPGEHGQACQPHLAIDEPEVECGVVGNEKLIGCQEAPYLGGMNRERVLQAQNRIREAMNPFGIAVISHAGIEHQIQTRQIRPAFGQVAADHSDAAKAYDAVVMTKSGGLDIAKRHGRRQVIQPHVPSSPSWGAANSTPPPPKPRGGLAALAGRRREPIKVRRPSAHAPSVQARSRVEIPALLPAWARQSQCSPRRRSCSAQDQGSARASAAMVRPAGAVPSRRPETIRGERNASGSSSRMCRSTLPSRLASTAKLPTRPWANSSTQLPALAIAISRASRRDGVIGVLCTGTWMMPLTAAGTGLAQGTLIVVTFAMGGADQSLLAVLWACGASRLCRSRSSRWFGVNITRSRWRSRRSRSLSGNCSPEPLALRWLRSAATTNASISAAGTRPTNPAGRRFPCSTAWEM